MADIIKPAELVVGTPGLIVGENMVELIVVDRHCGAALQSGLNQPPHRAIKEVVGDDVVELGTGVEVEGGNRVEFADFVGVVPKEKCEEDVVFSAGDGEGLNFPDEHPGFVSDGSDHKRNMVELSLGEKVDRLARNVVSVNGWGPGVEDVDGGVGGRMVHKLVLGGGDLIGG